MTTPRIDAPELVEGQAAPETTVNEIVRYLEASANFYVVLSSGTTAPPGSPTDGLVQIVGAGATGDWTGFTAGALALYIESAWVEIPPHEGTFAYNTTTDKLYKNNGTGGLAAWVEYAPSLTESIIIACSDETSAISTGTGKVTLRMPYAFTLSAVRASVTTAPTGANLVIDINESGSTILSTKLSIDAGEKTSTTAASPPVISDTALADDAEITIDFDQVGSTIAGAGVKVVLIGTRT